MQSRNSKVSILFQPYPFAGNTHAYRMAVWLSVFVTLFLLIYKPFGLHVLQGIYNLKIIGYGIITYITLTFNIFLISTFLPGTYREEQWKVYHQLIWIGFNLLVLGVTNFLYAVAVGSFQFDFLSFLDMETSLIMVSVIPIAASVLIRYVYELNKNLGKARELTIQLEQDGGKKSEQKDILPEKKSLTFTAENGKDTFVVDPEKIYVIESVDNYVDIYWLNKDAVSKTLLRSTLQKLEDQLKEHAQFFRCHRSYLVNMDTIKSVEGNSQGYLLAFPDMAQLVPVSRLKNKELKNRIQKQH